MTTSSTDSVSSFSGVAPTSPACGGPAGPSGSQEQYYERHIFFCLNERANGEDCCARHNAQVGFEHCKQAVKAAGLAGKGRVRVNKAGCLDRCAAGPVAVVYPEGVWYTFVDTEDIDEIVQSHLMRGQVVERLRVPGWVGR